MKGQDFIDGIGERLSDPFFSRFYVFFAVFNWKVVLAIFGSESTSSKIETIEELFKGTFGLNNPGGVILAFILPALMALGHLFYWTSIQIKLKRQVKDDEIKLNNEFLSASINSLEVAKEMKILRDEVVRAKAEKDKAELELVFEESKNLVVESFIKHLSTYSSRLQRTPEMVISELYELTRMHPDLALKNIQSNNGILNIEDFVESVEYVEADAKT